MGLSSIEVQHALWELASAGLAAADGFDQLRSMIDADRRRAANSAYRKARSAAGRWSLFRSDAAVAADAVEQARFNDIAIESAARMLLNRYGIVFRDLLGLESNTPRWGYLLRMFRRLEDRGEVRGGRFVSGFGGEQFALPEVLESLQATGNQALGCDITVGGADPVNLVGILLPGARVAASPGRSLILNDELLQSTGPMRTRSGEGFRQRAAAPPRRAPENDAERPGLFTIPPIAEGEPLLH